MSDHYAYYPEFKDPVRKVAGHIGRSKVSVLLGNLGTIESEPPFDGFVVPEAPIPGMEGTLRRAMMERKGAAENFAAYDNLPGKNMLIEKAVAIKAPEAGGRYFLHAVCKERTNVHEYSFVRKAFYEALKEAERKGVKKIAVPAMGMGGSLPAEFSAKAMMLSLYKYDSEGGAPLDVSFVLLGDRHAHAAFLKVLDQRTYENAPPYQIVHNMFSEQYKQTRKQISRHFASGGSIDTLFDVPGDENNLKNRPQGPEGPEGLSR